MTRTTKAVFLSMLVFPGAGHLLLKRYRTGALLAGVALVALYYLLSAATAMAQQISDQLLRGDIPLDAASILQAVQQIAAQGGQSANLSSLVLAACWLVGIMSAYHAGRSEDEKK